MVPVLSVEIVWWSNKDPIKFRGGSLNIYSYVANDPVNLVDRTGLGVSLCSEPANIVGGLVDHHWIKTDTKEAGMGRADDQSVAGEQFDLFGVPVKVKDETGRSSKPSATCRDVKGINEDEVNRQLEIDKPLGEFWPWNNCQTFSDDVLDNASYRPDPPDPSVAPPDNTLVNWGR